MTTYEMKKPLFCIVTKGSEAIDMFITFYDCDLWMQKDHDKRE
jgi:hypothetical protein